MEMVGLEAITLSGTSYIHAVTKVLNRERDSCWRVANKMSSIPEYHFSSNDYYVLGSLLSSPLSNHDALALVTFG